jgi:cell division protein FtsI (penicillin-binding protein 3)
MNIHDTRRVHLLARLAFLWAALIAARLLQLQIVQHDKYLSQAQQQQEKVVEVRAPRGTIIDRAGQPLAMSLPVDSVCVNPVRIPDLSVASDILARILDLNPSDLLGRMKLAADNRRGFLWVKRKVTPEQSKRLRDLNLDWVEFRTENVRFYPNKNLAAHVIGGVDFEERGNGGIEQSLNDDLEGHPGTLRVISDVKQRGFDSTMATEPMPGRAIQLTIDSRIQFVAEQELDKAVKAHHCKTGSVVAMNPKTGDILALANYPTYDPNEPPKGGEDLDARDNLAVTTPYEPGSVFKIITISAALETTRLRPETNIPCGNGTITLFGRTIHDHNRYASLPMEDVLARSSNIGAINIGLKVGDANMYAYMRRFGFGKATGLPLAGESAGMVRPLKYWQRSSIGSVAMGHEVSVTAVQLAQAGSVMANGGFLVKPRLLSDSPKETPRRVLKPETAITMRTMMEGVVIKPYGTGHKYAHIPGYTSGGKTGTAQIFDHKTHQYTHLYNASFVGFAPATNPAIVVVVTLNGTAGAAGYGGPTSAPVFREVAAAALRILDVPKDLPDDVPNGNEKVKADENDLSIADLGPSVPQPLVQMDDAVAPVDRPGASAKTDLDQRSFLGPPAPESPMLLAGPVVPNFQGKSLREVIQESAARGLPVEYVGTGVVHLQAPPPGVILPMGERVKIKLGQ